MKLNISVYLRTRFIYHHWEGYLLVTSITRMKFKSRYGNMREGVDNQQARGFHVGVARVRDNCGSLRVDYGDFVYCHMQYEIHNVLSDDGQPLQARGYFNPLSP